MNSNEVWMDDSIQFPRLLAEIAANVNLTNRQVRHLCGAMDISKDKLNELFDRAFIRFEKNKKKVCPVNKVCSCGRKKKVFIHGCKNTCREVFGCPECDDHCGFCS